MELAEDILEGSFEALDFEEDGEPADGLPEADSTQNGNTDPLVDSERAEGELVAALADLEDDFYRTGSPASFAELDRTAARHTLGPLTAVALTQMALDRNLISGEEALEQVTDYPADGKRTPGLSVAGVKDSLQAYLDGVGRHQLLTAQEEVDLARAYEAGVAAQKTLAAEGLGPEVRTQLEETVARGKQAFDRFLVCNLRLVISVAKSYRGQGLDFLELIQEGTLGLIRAVQKFDYRLGFKFSTYATWWIRQSAQRGVDDKGRVVRLPVHIKERLRKLKRRERELTVALEREPTVEEIGESLRWEPGYVAFLRQVAPDAVSLDQPVSDEDGSAALGDLIPDTGSPPDEEAIDKIEAERVRAWLAQLTFRERRVLELRYGIGGAPRTLDEVGQIFTITRERVRQIQNQAEKKLKQLAEVSRPGEER